MALQGNAAALHQNGYTSKVCPQAVGKREVDEPVHAGKGHGSLGPDPGQRVQMCTPVPG